MTVFRNCHSSWKKACSASKNKISLEILSFGHNNYLPYIIFHILSFLIFVYTGYFQEPTLIILQEQLPKSYDHRLAMK